MSKLLPVPPSPDQIRVVWFEFQKHCWTGTDYVSTIKVDAETKEGANRPLAEAYWREDQHWGFLMPHGCAVLVPDRNINFIYARTIGPEVQGEAEKQSERRPEDLVHEEAPVVDQNGFPLSKAQAAYQAPESNTVAAPAQAPAQAPKRRGRPPKVRPAE